MSNEEKPHSAEYFGEYRDHWWNRDFLALMAQRWRLDGVRDVADLGSGVGHWSFALASVLPEGCTITGVDREAAWVVEATRRAPAYAGRSHFRFMQGDLLSLPFADASFDLVTCQTVLIHVADPRKALREMLRVLRPGGLLLAVEPNNLAGAVSFGSIHAEADPFDLAAIVAFQLVCERGKRNLGLGDNSIGQLLPGMFADSQLTDLQVFVSDKACALFPPYEGAEQKANAEQLLEWVRRDVWIWERDETRRYFVAGGGEAGRFEGLWRAALKDLQTLGRALEAGTYHTAGGNLMYLVSGRKPKHSA